RTSSRRPRPAGRARRRRRHRSRPGLRAGRRAAHHHRHRPAPQRGAGPHRHPDRRFHLHVRLAGAAVPAGRRERADEPGDAAGAERGAGLLRPAAHPRRPQRAAVPSQRRDPSRRHQLLRPDPAAAHDRPVQADHREPAGRVRPAQRRNHRSHHQVRRAAARRRGVPVRRQPRLDRAERQLRRQRGQQQLLPHRRLHRQRPRHRVPDGSSTPLHDHTKQFHGFGYLEHIFDDSNRLSLIAGTSVDRFQIPNLRGLRSQDVFAPSLTVDGVSDFLSDDLDENQREITHFAALSLQHSSGPLSVQTSLVARYSSLDFSPDPNLGDLLFNGISQSAFKRDLAYGLQSDAAYRLSDAHTVRAGLFVQADRLTSDTASQVLPTDPLTGRPLNDVPAGIADNTSATQHIESLYLQDEWRFDEEFVVNYGLRFDHYSAFSSGSQLSPRLNIVWNLT